MFGCWVVCIGETTGKGCFCSDGLARDGDCCCGTVSRGVLRPRADDVEDVAAKDGFRGELEANDEGDAVNVVDVSSSSRSRFLVESGEVGVFSGIGTSLKDASSVRMSLKDREPPSVHITTDRQTHDKHTKVYQQYAI